jgi:AcrR family transcriptional regulator
MPSAPRTTTRSDAIANRDALLDAATRVLLRDGRQAPLEAIAREADLGAATLYRNFASRDELFGAVVHRSFAQIAALAAKAQRSRASAPNALSAFLRGIIAGRDLALPMLGSPLPSRSDTAALGAQIMDCIDDVLRRGVDAGTIRADATTTDIMIAMTTLAHAQLPPNAWRTVARRLATLIVDGLRPAEQNTTLPPGLSREQLYRAVDRYGGP